jgi:hypothetical protein
MQAKTTSVPELVQSLSSATLGRIVLSIEALSAGNAGQEERQLSSKQKA